jgi:hypothetical protein
MIGVVEQQTTDMWVLSGIVMKHRREWMSLGRAEKEHRMLTSPVGEKKAVNLKGGTRNWAEVGNNKLAELMAR